MFFDGGRDVRDERWIKGRKETKWMPQQTLSMFDDLAHWQHFPQKQCTIIVINIIILEVHSLSE